MLRERQGDFRGGLNLTADEEALAPNEVRRAENAVLDEFGAIKKRLGTKRLHTTALSTSGVTGPIQSGYAWLKGNGSQQLMVVHQGQLFTGTYGVPMTWTAQGAAGALNAQDFPAMIAFRDITAGEVVFIADGDYTGSSTPTALNYWDGTNLVTNLAGTPADIRHLAVYNQRLFGVTGRDQSIWWSGINNGRSLGAAGSGGGQAIVRTFSDQNITGIAPFGSSLLIFHVSGISRFTGLTQDDIQIGAGAQGLTSDVGAVSGRSIVPTPVGVFFLSDRGWYVATETSVAPIATKIAPVWRDIELGNKVTHGVHNASLNEVWWFVRTPTGRTGVYRYNYVLNAWTGPHTGGYVDATSATRTLFEAVNDNKQPIVLRGDQFGFVSQCDMPDVFRDDAPATGTGGIIFAMAVQCRRMFFGDAVTKKKMRWGFLQVGLRASQAASLSWETEEASGTYSIQNPAGTVGAWGTGTWGTGTWGAGGNSALRFPVWGGGTYCDVTLSDSGEAQSVWSLAEIEAFDYGRRY